MTNALVLKQLFGALQFAAHKHRNQFRKGSPPTPYINHPIAVAATLVNVGGVDDLELIEVALLHDTVEDTDTLPEEVEQRFGARIRALVMEMTDDKTLEKKVRKLEQIKNAPYKSVAAKKLKLADKTCNVRDIREDPPADWDLDRKIAYFDWAEAVVAGLRGVNELLERHFDNEVAMSRKAIMEGANGS